MCLLLTVILNVIPFCISKVGGFKRPMMLGRLSTKFEGAGKVRLFAITDGWTQSLLRPLHDIIFKSLRKLPQDGTFDQNAPFELLRSLVGSEPMFSFDLKSATDRLPVRLQTDLLSHLMDERAAKS